MKACYHCGAPIPATAKFCQGCGNPQPEQPPATPQEQQQALQQGYAMAAADQQQPPPAPQAPAPPAQAYGAPPPQQPYDTQQPYSQQPPYGQPQQQPYGQPPYAQQQPAYAAQDQYGAPAPAKKKGGKKLILIIVAAVLVVALALGAVFFLPGLLGGGGSFQGTAGNIAITYNAKTSDGNRYAALANGSILSYGKAIESTSTSLDQKLAYATELAGDYSDDGYTLYDLAIFDEKGTEIFSAKDVFRITFNRSTKVLYYMQDGRSGGLFQVVNGKEQLLTSSAQNYVPSMNDKYVFFIDDEELFSVQPGKEPVSIDRCEEDTIPAGISNDGKYMFFADPPAGSSNAEFVCITRDGTATSVRIKGSLDDVAFNTDCTEAVISSSDAGLWLFQKGQFVDVADAGALVYTALHSSGYVRGANARFLPVSNFNTFAFVDIDTRGGDEILCVYSNGTVVEIEDDVSNALVSQDCSVILYDLEGTLRRVTLSGANIQSDDKISNDVYDYRLSNDGKILYYFIRDEDEDNMGELYYQSGGNDAVLLSDEASTYFSISVDGSHCAFINDYDIDDMEGELLLSKNGGEPQSLGDASRVYSVSPSGTLFYATGRKENSSGSGYLAELYFYRGGQAELLEKNMVN